jgi:hypothetical protein
VADEPSIILRAEPLNINAEGIAPRDHFVISNSFDSDRSISPRMSALLRPFYPSASYVPQSATPIPSTAWADLGGSEFYRRRSAD